MQHTSHPVARLPSLDAAVKKLLQMGRKQILQHPGHWTDGSGTENEWILYLSTRL